MKETNSRKIHELKKRTPPVKKRSRKTEPDENFYSTDGRDLSVGTTPGIFGKPTPRKLRFATPNEEPAKKKKCGKTYIGEGLPEPPEISCVMVDGGQERQ